ncbi:MAG: translation initiation factor IF-1 [Patescibacteria group bacterium]|nr:translation initiation factor IF-1 [Patescibacteria group bacterium]MCL5257657.1 translation initiation factor IF-1 [Patescibacteria group bacterium]
MKKELVEGRVLESLPAASFRVELSDGREILAYLAGRMRLHYIKIVAGDAVTIELSPYDQNRGRIIKRK